MNCLLSSRNSAVGLDVIELSVGAVSSGHHVGIVLCRQHAGVLLESLLRGDEVASLATAAAAEPFSRKWSKLLRLPFPTSPPASEGLERFF